MIGWLFGRDDDEQIDRLSAEIGILRRDLRDEAFSRVRMVQRVAELEALVAELADDLEAEVRASHGVDRGEVHPAIRHRYERDMEPVVRARAVLGGGS